MLRSSQEYFSTVILNGTSPGFARYKQDSDFLFFQETPSIEKESHKKQRKLKPSSQ